MGLLAQASLGASSWAWAMIPSRDDENKKAGKLTQGRLVVTVTVRGSSTRVSAMSWRMNMNSSDGRPG